MSTRYPNCEKAGLGVYKARPIILEALCCEVTNAADVEAYLAKIKCMCEYNEKYFPSESKEPAVVDDRQVADKSQAPELGELAFTDKDFMSSWLQYEPGKTLLEGKAENAATIANRILAEKLQAAPVVYGTCASGIMNFSDPYGRQNKALGHVDTHTARLVAITPIAKTDTFEQFVKDMAEHAKFQYGDGKWAMNAEYWVDRAKRLVEGK